MRFSEFMKLQLDSFLGRNNIKRTADVNRNQIPVV